MRHGSVPTSFGRAHTEPAGCWSRL